MTQVFRDSSTQGWFHFTALTYTKLTHITKFNEDQQIRWNMLKKDNISLHATLAEATVAAGFPSPAEAYTENPLDLNELLIKKPQATFFVRVQGDSMINAGVYNGDLVIVDRSLAPANGQVVVAIIDGEFTLKRFLQNLKGVFLIPENSAYPTLTITEEMDFQVWGVATFVIHSLTA